MGLRRRTRYERYDSFYRLPLLGDVDMDGCINGIDALMVLRKAMGIIELTENQCRLADVDFNGEVTVNDAVRILRHALGIELLG